MKIIETEGLGKRVNGKTILEDISLKINSKSYGIIGRNGSGKTTLLRILSTQIVPTAGSCTLLGYDLVKERNEIRKRIGALTERDYFYGALTVRENLKIFSELAGVKKERVAYLIKKLGLEKYENVEFSNLSSGIKRICRFCKAIMNKPDLLILDEPFYSLDEENSKNVRRLIKKDCKYFIMSAHHLEPEMFAKHCILENGRVVVNE